MVIKNKKLQQKFHEKEFAHKLGYASTNNNKPKVDKLCDANTNTWKLLYFYIKVLINNKYA